MSLILALNAGSSSLKFSAYGAVSMVGLATAQVESIGAEARLVATLAGHKVEQTLGQVDHAQALGAVMDALSEVLGSQPVLAVGHRIVHGGADHDTAVVLDQGVLAELEALVPFAPLHQPHNIAGVAAAQARFPDALQIGCFDTAFHRDQPWVNDTFALPQRFYEQGVRRYGFHGLSYEYIRSVLQRDEPELIEGRVIIAHLGNGASMCAMLNGRSVGSTMGFTALDGLPMGTRCGQLDPGVVLYLLQQLGMSAEEVTELLYRQSGLKGLSGLSNDMRELLASDDIAARQAIDYYVFRIAREIGALSAVLGGVDALVFTGGIGEHAAAIRARATENLVFLGISLDNSANQQGRRNIASGEVPVLVIPTDEEVVIARACRRFL